MSSKIENIDQRIDNKKEVDQIKFHLQNILNSCKKPRIQENDFEDVFGPKIIEDDLKLVKEIKNGFQQKEAGLEPEERENKKHGEKIGEALEIIITEDGERYAWFGSNSHLSRTCEYDDFVQKVDVILETIPESDKDKEKPRSQHIALAIDASSNLDDIHYKMKRNEVRLFDLNKNNPPGLKYYQSSINPNIKGPLELVIPVVIGLESKCVRELITASSVVRFSDDIIKNKPDIKDAAEENKRKNNKILELHPAQIIFCQQILTQLNHYLKILKYRHDETGKNYQSEVEMLLEEFKKIMSEKEKLETFNENWQGEAVLQKIKSYTDNTNIDYSIYASGNVYDAPRKTVIYKRKKKPDPLPN